MLYKIITKNLTYPFNLFKHWIKQVAVNFQDLLTFTVSCEETFNLHNCTSKIDWWIPTRLASLAGIGLHQLISDILISKSMMKDEIA